MWMLWGKQESLEQTTKFIEIAQCHVSSETVWLSDPFAPVHPQKFLDHVLQIGTSS